METNAMTNTKRKQAPGSVSSVWEWYKDVARDHRGTLELLDETLSKLLFWIPHSDANSASNGDETEGDYECGYELGDAAWREVGYGILSLHRLSLHLASDDEDKPNTTNLRRNHYGTSIRTQTRPSLPATSVRIGLTVIHSIMPSLLSLAMLRARTKEPTPQHPAKRNPESNYHSYRMAAAASKVRLLLEQVKFLLRLTLLIPYWRQQQQQQIQYSSIPSSERDDVMTNAADYGIMLHGGLYHSDQHQESIGIPWDHALALQRRRNYVGERTGWKTSGGGSNTTSNDSAGTSIRSKFLGDSFLVTKRLFGDGVNYSNAKIAVAELLYTFRPLLWAWFESRYQTSRTKRDKPKPWRGATSPYHIRQEGVHRPSLLKGWLVCLAMDLLSIRLLEERQEYNRRPNHRNANSRSRVFPWDHSSRNNGHASRNTNPLEDAELQRRKLRLWLYLLRSPVWSTQTLPALEGISQTVLRRIPILGNLAETALWDWILYYQHPFVAEEG